MESCVADLIQKAQCPFCQEPLVEPKVLPCSDVFCKRCIERHAELIDKVRVFKCPRCQSQTPLPEPNSVEKLQPSLPHSRIVKILMLFLGEAVCSVSESHPAVCCICFDCDRSLCSECKESHSKDHKVVRLVDLKKEDIEFLITREKPACPEKGELGRDPSDVTNVQIKPEENVEIVKKYVRGDGKVVVEFIAKVAGRLTAEVEVHGSLPDGKRERMKSVGQFMKPGEDEESSWLSGIAVNKDNSRIAVSHQITNRVDVFTTDGKLLLTYGSEGSTQEKLYGPLGLAFLNDTDVVIADQGNHRICIVNTTTGTLLKTFGKDYKDEGQRLRYPSGVHVDDNGNIIVCDHGNQRVQVFTRDGEHQCKSQFGLTPSPYDVVTHDGLFYVSDSAHHVIEVFEKKGDVLTRRSTIGGEGIADGQLNGPKGLAIDNDNHLLVCDEGNDRIQKFTLDGRFVGRSDEIMKPEYITVLKDGQLLVSTIGSGVLYVK